MNHSLIWMWIIFSTTIACNGTGENYKSFAVHSLAESLP